MKATMGGGSRPLLPVCYICGRQFGTQSLAIHEKACLKKWQQEQDKLPAHLKRGIPQKPDPSLSQADANEAAYESYSQSLVPCENCGRTFLPDRLEVHLRSCRPGKTSSPRSPSPRGKSARSPAVGSFPQSEDPVLGAWATERLQKQRNDGFKFEGVQY